MKHKLPVQMAFLAPLVALERLTTNRILEFGSGCWKTGARSWESQFLAHKIHHFYVPKLWLVLQHSVLLQKTLLPCLKTISTFQLTSLNFSIRLSDFVNNIIQRKRMRKDMKEIEKIETESRLNWNWKRVKYIRQAIQRDMYHRKTDSTVRKTWFV